MHNRKYKHHNNSVCFQAKAGFPLSILLYSAPKDKAVMITTDKCSREKHSTQCTSPPWSNEKIAINKKTSVLTASQML